MTALAHNLPIMAEMTPLALAAPAEGLGSPFAGPEARDGQGIDQGGDTGKAGGLREPEGENCAAPVDRLPELPAGVRWLNVATAAERKRVDARTIRRWAPRWRDQGKAIQVRRADGGEAPWYIRTDADPKLADVRFPDAMPVNTRGLPDHAREELGRRVAIMGEWEAACGAAVRACVPNAQRLTKEDATRLYVARLKSERGIELSPQTLRRWHRQYRQGGAAALIDGRHERRMGGGKGRGDDPFLNEVKALYLTRSDFSARVLPQAGGAKGG